MRTPCVLSRLFYAEFSLGLCFTSSLSFNIYSHYKKHSQHIDVFTHRHVHYYEVLFARKKEKKTKLVFELNACILRLRNTDCKKSVRVQQIVAFCQRKKQFAEYKNRVWRWKRSEKNTHHRSTTNTHIQKPLALM